jgi:hypothetical protein
MTASFGDGGKQDRRRSPSVMTTRKATARKEGKGDFGDGNKKSNGKQEGNGDVAL